MPSIRTSLTAPAFGGQRVAGASLLEQWLLYHQACPFCCTGVWQDWQDMPLHIFARSICAWSFMFKVQFSIQTYFAGLQVEKATLSSNSGIWKSHGKPALLQKHRVTIGHRRGSLCIVWLGWICKSYARAISDKGNRKGAHTQVHQYVPKDQLKICAL